MLLEEPLVVSHKMYRLIHPYGFCCMCGEFSENLIALADSQEEADKRFGEDNETGAMCPICMTDLLTENPYYIGLTKWK